MLNNILRITVKKFYLLLISVLFLFTACGKKDDANKVQNSAKGEFRWMETLSPDKIPDMQIKGMINGKPVNIEYVNFEKWRGSGDNVINFSDKKPKQNCGFIENDMAFHLTRASGDFAEGEFVKESFNKNIDGYSAEFHYYTDNNIKKVSVPWNCVLKITEIDDNSVKGKIAICFKDDSKSWIAGNFEAVRCNN
jgi:hypothetical protein